MTDEQAYKAYFQGLATSHADIDNFLFGDEEEMVRVQRSGSEATGICLWLDYHQPIRGAGSHDNAVGRLTAEWVVMQPAHKNNFTTAELQIKLKECEDIVQQMFAKIMYDYQTDVIAQEPDWLSMQFGRMQQHTFAGTSYEGIAAQIDFIVNVNTEFNQAKWT